MVYLKMNKKMYRMSKQELETLHEKTTNYFDNWGKYGLELRDGQYDMALSVFDAIADHIIIGGYDENGKKDENMIRFICKSNFNETIRGDLKSDIIIINNNLSNEESNFVNVLNFNSNQEFYTFKKMKKVN